MAPALMLCVHACACTLIGSVAVTYVLHAHDLAKQGPARVTLLLYYYYYFMYYSFLLLFDLTKRGHASAAKILSTPQAPAVS